MVIFSTTSLSNVDVSENDVVQSYRDFASPDGLLGRYLSKACLALRLGNVLFIHGALPLTDILCDDNTYKYPTPWNGGHVRTLDSWISHLNDFVIDEFDAWKHSIKNHGNGEQLAIWSTIGGYQSGSSGGGLIQCKLKGLLMLTIILYISKHSVCCMQIS